ncbi:MAG TPA: FecR domain-containing protein [Sphingobacteriaceae bacterium]|nr:FecR domain-containing protein [Sphingobacteriaceae bacterium]
MENESHFWDLSAKYLHGKATAQEQEQLQKLRALSSEHENQFQAMEKVWAATGYKPERDADIDKAWARTERVLQARINEKRPVRLLYSVLKVAALVAIVSAAVWLFRSPVSPFDKSEIVKANGKRTEVVLPDGSQVWLNIGSELVYSKDFNGPERTVELKGEGFFEVQPDPDRPFIIHTGKVYTEVLGTSFNLSAYPADSVVDLAVATGKVLFRTEGSKDEAIVTRGKAARITKLSGRLSTFNIKGKNEWSWKSGELKFTDAPLKDVLKDLEKHYRVKLVLEGNNLQSCRFTGNFKNAKLEEILQVLQASLDLTYKETAGKTISINGRGCH